MKKLPWFGLGVCLAIRLIPAGSAQVSTIVDLRTQSKNADFTGAPFTRPFKLGTVLPATCTVGDMYFKSNAAAGQNIYACTSTNVWTSPGTATSFSQLSGTAGVPQGGTGLTSIAAGSLLFAPSLNTFQGATLGTSLQVNNDVLSVNVSGLDLSALSLPASQIGSGILPVARGGTGSGDLASGAILTGGGTNPIRASGCTADIFGNLTCAGTVLAGNQSAQPGEILLYDSGGINFSSWLAPPTVPSAVRYQLPAAEPVSGQIMTFGAPAGGISEITFTTPVTAAGADLLQNKTLDNTNRLSEYTSWAETVTPPAADAGYLRVYAKSGKGICWVNPAGAETCAGSDSGSVSSVFGRSGAITAQAGDYSAAQVTNAADLSAGNTFSAGARQTFQASASAAGIRVACAALPSTPGAGDLACDSNDGNALKQWTGSAWLKMGSGSGGLAESGNNGLVIRNGASSTARTLSGTSSRITVTNGDGVSGNPTIDVGANVELIDTNHTISGDRTYTGKQDASGATATFPFQTGLRASLPATCTAGQHYFATDGDSHRRLYGCTASNTWSLISYPQGTAGGIPGACDVGQIYFATDATAGQNLYYCTSTNSWTQQSGGAGGVSLPSQTGHAGQSLVTDGTASHWGYVSPVNLSVAGLGLDWVFGKCSYCTSGRVIAAANGGFMGVFKLNNSVTATAAVFRVASGAGASKGLRFAIYDVDKQTILCKSEAGYSGHGTASKDINTMGDKALQWTSGTKVASNTCSLSPGYYWFAITSDSTALMLLADGSTAQSGLISADGIIRWGYTTAALSTGSGSSIDFAASAWSFTGSLVGDGQPTIGLVY